MATTSSSIPFRPRQPSAGTLYSNNDSTLGTTTYGRDILFPKDYEYAWGRSGDTSASDFDRALVFVRRIPSLIQETSIVNDMHRIVTDKANTSVIALVRDIQRIIFDDRHVTFATNRLIQAVRFLLIKTRIPEVALSDRAPAKQAQAVIDFFFDPTLEINLRPRPPGEISIYPCPQGRLKVVIIGGGPTALASAISLAEKGGKSVEVHLWERRWVEKKLHNGKTIFDYPATARRRDQVVTLQDSVTKLLSKPSYEALFAGRPERVWPGSANIQIRKVEDRFLKRVQEPEFKGIIHLHAEGASKDDLEKVGDFHVLLGCDGAASWVRGQYFEGYENERGRSWALGIAFDRPAGLPWSQPLNMFLTLGQTRYLLNASDYDGRGYLNMQLTDEEWHKMVSVDGQPIHFGRPGCLRLPDGSVPPGFEPSQVFAPSEDRSSPLWTSIEDGLKLFGFKESEVINIVRIPIVVQGVREGVQLLPGRASSSIQRPHALVAVAGDAGMTVHFWPGRGLNSGIKSGLAIGDELIHALKGGKFIGAPVEAMKEYNDFILKLQKREHDKRSIPILNQSGSPETLGWLLDKASTVPDTVATEWLVGAMTQIADRLQGRPDWNFETVKNVEPQIRICLRQMQSITLREMAVSFPWPTREMAGSEVLPVRSMKPAEKQKWLQGLWNRIQEEQKNLTSRSQTADVKVEEKISSGRFEAPKGVTPRRTSLTPNGGLQRSNATQSIRHGRNKSLTIPRVNGDGTELESMYRSRSPSPSQAADGEVTLSRMMTVSRRPPQAMLTEALSLALFRMKEGD